jgi:A/G-specific adenine glycosylase
MMHPTTRRLLHWYDRQGRDLPWRRDPTPYHTWLSEIMLQQTRVEAVIPYYQRFLARWPTVESLASASLEEVLGAWAGLGYYGRARNLHRAAGQVLALGAFPDTARGLRELAGVGEYTAAAIASIAFGRDAISVDGNLRRVVARLAAIDLLVTSGPGARALRSWLEARLPTGQAGAYNQALMDLGATVCLPRGPRCGLCPLVQDCEARAAGRQDELPRLPARKAPRPVSVVALLLERDGSLLLRQRPDTGLLAGLWGPPDRIVEGRETSEDALAALARELGLGPSAHPRSLGSLEHTFTHQRWSVCIHAVPAPVGLAPPDMRWWRQGREPPPPLSRLAQRILERYDAVAEH